MILKFKHLTSALNEYLVGNANTRKIIKPGELSFSDIYNCRVVEIDAKGNSPVIWIDYNPESDVIDERDIQ